MTRHAGVIEDGEALVRRRREAIDQTHEKIAAQGQLAGHENLVVLGRAAELDAQGRSWVEGQVVRDGDLSGAVSRRQRAAGHDGDWSFDPPATAERGTILHRHRPNAGAREVHIVH